MENLNKEEFFNGMTEKYPKAMESFCDWIDSYKELNSWDKLFKKGIKFHDIPFEMQLGIIMKYAQEIIEENKEQPEIEFLTLENVKGIFEEVLKYTVDED